MVGELVVDFLTLFLSIFARSMPFLLLGALISGLINEFVSSGEVLRAVPRGRLGAALAGLVLALAFPVTECGIVPVVRRLFRKGLPAPAGVGLLLAAPVINPLVLALTFSAYGGGRVLALRAGLGAAIALAAALVLTWRGGLTDLLHAGALPPVQGGAEATHTGQPVSVRMQSALRAAADDVFDFGGYMVAGALLAALLQLAIPTNVWLGAGQAPATSVLALQGLSFVLAVPSAGDTSLSLAFSGTTPPGSLLAFLLFGSMVDVKSLLMLRPVFRVRAAALLVALLAVLTFAAGVALNLVGG